MAASTVTTADRKNFALDLYLFVILCEFRLSLNCMASTRSETKVPWNVTEKMNIKFSIGKHFLFICVCATCYGCLPTYRCIALRNGACIYTIGGLYRVCWRTTVHGTATHITKHWLWWIVNRRCVLFACQIVVGWALAVNVRHSNCDVRIVLSIVGQDAIQIQNRRRQKTN